MVGVSMFLDFVAGISAAWKNGQKISSARMRDTVVKALVYQCCVLSAFLLETFLLGGVFPVAKLVGGAIGVVETKSIHENGERIAGVPLFAAVLDRLKSRGGDSKPGA